MRDQVIDEEVPEPVEGYESEIVRLWSRNELGNAAGVIARPGGRLPRIPPTGLASTSSNWST